MPTSIFVSHVYEDLNARDTIRNWAAQGLLGPNVHVTGESEDVRQAGYGAIRNHLSPLLQHASAVVVLIGNNTHNHGWIEYEAQHALSARKRVVPMRIPNTTGAAPGVLGGLGLLPMTYSALRLALGT